MITDEMKLLMKTPPPASALATRQQGGKTLSYLEGWYVIQKANEIFGEGNWTRRFHSDGLREVHHETTEVKGRKRYDVSFICNYMVAVGDECSQDVGYGNGMSYNSFGDAYELAVKEAVTDALKRCLRSFGNAFGNCLYDKKWVPEREKPTKPPENFATCEPYQPKPQQHPEPPPQKTVTKPSPKRIFWKAFKERFESSGIPVPEGDFLKNAIRVLCSDKNTAGISMTRSWNMPHEKMEDVNDTGWLVLAESIEKFDIKKFIP